MSNDTNKNELPSVIVTSCVINEIQVPSDDPLKPTAVVQIDIEGATENGGEFAQSWQMPLALWLAIKEKLR